MWIQVRSMDGKKSSRVDGLSKLTRIEELRELLVDKFSAPVSRQRLFYRGKQLEDGHTLFDYDVGLNDIVQILVRQEAPPPPPPSSSKDKENEVGDRVDAKDSGTGAWFEAKVVDILPDNEKQTLRPSSSNQEEDNLLYSVLFEDYEDSEGPVEVRLAALRPRARRLVPFGEVKEGDVVMVNYNVEEPKERGFWYDCTVTGKRDTRTRKELLGSIAMGPSEARLDDCRILFTEEIFAIEENVASSRHQEDGQQPLRLKKPQCSHCKDVPSRKCKVCSCSVCGGKDEPGKQIICDECDLPYHLWCLHPPLKDIPQEDEWYCPGCKIDETEVVRAGERLKSSKKKAKMASASSSSSRDWGKGMACVGRTRECTLVPPNHFGPIPGVEVGTLWKFRVQVSESGVHRPHVAGIHGREGDGAFSIVLSGGYEDDLDEGEEFKYTGSGGRDLSGNKRCAEQSCDQTLTRMNR
ncbi:E3 ubiquitin-protein ligase UHRF1-like [Uloborus diversus]|uniref:E3 ubiquitin-protein ligase UHRF1-like n=1 Tax=Uloborus diversus TaxID=327109 RepID=UPI00240A2B50|nr:E3 ubiquitin-protein ligase UHRF1-like [Uloborus diversus]